MDKGIDADHTQRPERNPVKIVFIVVSVLAALYFVTGVMSLVFPEWGIPFIYMAFPVGPSGPSVD